ncbi:MAG: tyrosine-type recombinase/integrase [Acidimicrobiia bacterium]|nr:tyrosine-type recombinase/integrase [Acidimicrobiia bacterium]
MSDGMSDGMGEVRGLVADWLVGMTPNTRSGYGTDVAQFITYLENVNVGLLVVSRPVVQRWLAELIGKGLAPKTVQRKASAVHSLFSYLTDEGHVETDPTVHLRRPKGEGPQKSGLTPAQARLLISAARDRSAAAHALVWLMVGVGLRIAEACTARLEDISDDVLTVTVKGGHRQAKPLSPPVLEAVRRAAGDRKEGPILLTSEGRPLSRRAGWETIVELSTSVGVEKCTPHTLRHTAATLALEAGAPVQDVQQLLGHRSIETTLRYIAGRNIRTATAAAARLLGDTLTRPDNEP